MWASWWPPSSRGSRLSEEDLTNLQNIVTFLNGLDVTGTGQHIKEGVAQGMTEAGWASGRRNRRRQP